MSRGLFHLFAIFLPGVLLALHHDTGHLGDIAFFHDWLTAFRQGPTFYESGPGLNYPILGVLLVCGPARFIEVITGSELALAQYTWVLKTTLALGEVCLILAAAALLHRIRIANARRWALVLYACPCIWAPGAWFGQIDVWGTVALLIAFIGIVDYRRKATSRSLTVALLGIVAALLIKQLTWFTLPALGLGLAAGLIQHARRGHIALVACSPVLLFAADPLLVLPNGYISHLAWVWFGGGSSHADLIVAGGASMWSLIADVNASAHEWQALGLSAYVWGLLLFIGTQIPLALRLRRFGLTDTELLRYAGVTNLAMVTLMTGVHERYFVHGAPLLLIALFAAPPLVRFAGWFVATWWGLFVLGSVHFDAFAGIGSPFRWHVPAAVLLLLLLLALLMPEKVWSRSDSGATSRPTAGESP